VIRVGVDLGGTKIEALALATDGTERFRRRVPTPQGDYDGTIAAIAALVAECERAVGESASVGIGTPGAASRASGLMKNCNSTVLNGRPLQADLERALGRPVRLANDANCFTVSEARDGAAAGLACVFGVILGTGVGGAIAIGGVALDGANAIAGEWGHNPLPPRAQCSARDRRSPHALRAAFAAPAPRELPGPACYCGRRGCVETWLSGPAWVADHRRAGGTADSAATLVQAMRAGDPIAQASYLRYVDRLARALATVINVVDPDAIVLGGGLSNIDELYRDVPAHWSRYVFSDAIATRLLRNRHGDASGVRGAAWLWD
jgi:predicted NBD/HSP70 family sugar kinase